LPKPGAAPPAWPARHVRFARGTRVFHEKFGYGTVVEQEGNKLEIEFENGGHKRVLDSFVKVA
jgi:DNA helicase-2/ATP-dependent DNA helicase PcrA